MWMKLQTKRISPKENLISTHLKYKLVMLLVADEGCQHISWILVECSAFKLSQRSAVNAETYCISQTGSVKRSISHKRCCYCSVGLTWRLETSYTRVQWSVKREETLVNNQGFYFVIFIYCSIKIDFKKVTWCLLHDFAWWICQQLLVNMGLYFRFQLDREFKSPSSPSA